MTNEIKDQVATTEIQGSPEDELRVTLQACEEILADSDTTLDSLVQQIADNFRNTSLPRLRVEITDTNQNAISFVAKLDANNQLKYRLFQSSRKSAFGKPVPISYDLYIPLSIALAEKGLLQGQADQSDTGPIASIIYALNFRFDKLSSHTISWLKEWGAEHPNGVIPVKEIVEELTAD